MQTPGLEGLVAEAGADDREVILAVPRTVAPLSHQHLLRLWSRPRKQTSLAPQQRLQTSLLLTRGPLPQLGRQSLQLEQQFLQLK